MDEYRKSIRLSNRSGIQVRRTYRTCFDTFLSVCTCSALGVSVYFQKENVKITQGTLKSYKLINESGKEMDFQFCATCGSTLLLDIELPLDLIGTSGGAHDPPTFWYSVDREVFQRSKAEFVHIDSPESYATSRLYDPIHTDDPRLKGGY